MTNILNFDISNTKKNIKDFKVKNNRIFLPWVEKYRPNKLDDIILDEITKNKMTNFLMKSEISNMIITGHPGTGKTTTILCLARQIYENDFNEHVIEYNASDNRGLETINNSIIYFCKKKCKPNLQKLVILDEADNITKKAQNTLCNLMELYNKTTKFVLTCNDYNKLIEGIQTRCLIIRYNSLPPSLIKERLTYICEKENITYNDEGLDAIIFISQGDVRIAINCLESTYFGFKKITYKNVYKICEKPSKMEIIELLKLCKGNKNILNIINRTLKFKIDGYCNNDIILTLINVIKEIDYDNGIKIKLIEIASMSYITINDGTDTDLQLLNCIIKIYKVLNE